MTANANPKPFNIC